MIWMKYQKYKISFINDKVKDKNENISVLRYTKIYIIIKL